MKKPDGACTVLCVVPASEAPNKHGSILIGAKGSSGSQLSATLLPSCLAWEQKESELGSKCLVMVHGTIDGEGEDFRRGNLALLQRSTLSHTPMCVFLGWGVGFYQGDSVWERGSNSFRNIITTVTKHKRLG